MQERPELTAEQRAETEALETLLDDQVDTTDISEVLDWSDARRGVFYRPQQVQRHERLE